MTRWIKNHHIKSTAFLFMQSSAVGMSTRSVQDHGVRVPIKSVADFQFNKQQQIDKADYYE